MEIAVPWSGHRRRLHDPDDHAADRVARATLTGLCRLGEAVVFRGAFVEPGGPATIKRD